MSSKRIFLFSILSLIVLSAFPRKPVRKNRNRKARTEQKMAPARKDSITACGDSAAISAASGGSENLSDPFAGFSFDEILSSMEEAEATRGEKAVGLTIDYLDDLFSNSPDHEHPQIIGGAVFLMKKNYDAIPSGNIPINVSEFVMPMHGRLSSRFGYRTIKKRHHNGIDVAITKSDTVRAAFPGKVELTGEDAGGYGFYMVLSHPNGLQTLYAHLDKFLVVPETELEAGQPIAIGGQSGNSTGPHLHFEIRYQGLPINPAAVVNLRTCRPRSATFVFNKDDILRARESIAQPATDAKK